MLRRREAHVHNARFHTRIEAGNRGHDGPAIVNTRAVGLSYPLHAAAFATFSPSSTPRSICWASSCGDA
jgi:hypothetical protein